LENIWKRTRFTKNKGPGSEDSNIDATPNLLQELRPRVSIIAFGLIAGLVSSLAISGLILMVEKVTAVPVGTFYMVIIAAITDSQLYSVNMIVSGLLLHLICGSVIGVLMALPFIHYKKNSNKTLYQYAPVFGLLFGLALWSIMFLPITYWMVLPLISSLENQTIEQQVPTGPVASIDNSKLLEMSNRIIFGALPFNMLYGLLVAIIIKSLSEDYLHRKHSLRNSLKEPTS
jgi:riboflavin transporter FmnP